LHHTGGKAGHGDALAAALSEMYLTKIGAQLVGGGPEGFFDVVEH
jgi:hypothetical protein